MKYALVLLAILVGVWLWRSGRGSKAQAPKAPKAPRTRKEPKPKKIVPEHTHPIGESHPHCALCQTHGDCMDPTLPEHNFEGSDDITERLRELLSRERVCGETESV